MKGKTKMECRTSHKGSLTMADCAHTAKDKDIQQAGVLQRNAMEDGAIVCVITIGGRVTMKTSVSKKQ